MKTKKRIFNLNYLEQIENAKKIAIITHRNADMDAIGSAISLKMLINKNFEEKMIDIFTDSSNINVDDINKNIYAVFTKDRGINKQNSKKYDLAICLDCSSLKLMGSYVRIFKKSKDSLNIDHHQSNEIYAKNNIVVPKFSSTCEMIYYMFVKMKNLNYSNVILRLLYAGIITDTNNLTNNIGKNTFDVIDEICGKDTQRMEQLEKIRNYFFKNETKSKFLLLSKALDSIKFSNNGKIAMMKITKKDFFNTNACMTDTLGIVDYATKLQGVEIACMFIKQDDNTYYVSLRSKNEVNVGTIAEKMNGGGHEKIAAFQTKPTDKLNDIKTKLFSLCQEQLKNCNQKESLDELFVE